MSENLEFKKIEIDPVLIKEIKNLKPEKMKKKNPKKLDLSNYIGLIDSEEFISDSVKEHDLL